MRGLKVKKQVRKQEFNTKGAKKKENHEGHEVSRQVAPRRHSNLVGLLTRMSVQKRKTLTIIR
jgi:hypothetical protein